MQVKILKDFYIFTSGQHYNVIGETETHYVILSPKGNRITFEKSENGKLYKFIGGKKWN